MGNNSSQGIEYGELIPNDVNVSWKCIQSALPEGLPNREGQCSCSCDKTFYVFGGVLQGNNLESEPQESNDLLAFCTDTNKWVKMKTKGKTPAPRSSASLVALGSKLYLFGGLSHLTGWFDVLHEYDTETNTWSEVKTEGTAPSPRDKSAIVAIGTYIYLFGGFGPKSEEFVSDESDEEDELPDGGASFGWFNDLFIFDTVSKKWSQPMQMNLGVPTPRAAHGMCAVGQDLVIFGGRDTVGRRNDVHMFDTVSRKWKDCKVKGRQPEPRSFHSTTAVGNRLVVMGGRGESNQHFADLHIFDTETMEWLQPKVNGDLPSGRGQHSVGVVGNQVVLFGGTSDFSPEIMQCHTFFSDTYVANTDDFLKGQSGTKSNAQAS